jgi:hypothetical protein
VTGRSFHRLGDESFLFGENLRSRAWSANCGVQSGVTARAIVPSWKARGRALGRFLIQGCNYLLDYLFDRTASINDEGVLRSLQGGELALEQSFGKKVGLPFSQSFRQCKLIDVKEYKVDSR